MNISDPSMDEILVILKKNLSNDAGMCRHYLTLWSFILGIEAENMFEFGSGFSTLTALSALNITGGNLKSIDIRPTIENKELSSNFGNYIINKYGDRWSFYQGDSLKSFSAIKHDLYDIVLHDGTHTGEEVYYDIMNISPYIKNDGFILIHDTNHPELGEEMSMAATNIMTVLSTPSYPKGIPNIKLPWGYGMTLIQVKNDNPSISLSWKKT